MKARGRNLLAVVLVCMAAGCGGGSGGGDAGGGPGVTNPPADVATEGDVQVSFDSALLRGSGFEGQDADTNAFEDAVVEVEFTISGAPSTGTIYARVEDAQGVFEPTAVGLGRLGGSRFRARFALAGGKPAGTYTGTLALRLCSDAACNSRYRVGGGSIAYEVVITPQLQAEILVNGAAAGTLRSGQGNLVLSVANGSTIEVRSNIPVQLMYSTGPGFIVHRLDAASTPPLHWYVTVSRATFPSTTRTMIVLMPDDTSRFKQRAPSLDVTVGP